MREPAFWYGRSSALSALLSPVSAIYGWLSARRMRRTGQRVGIPVICIGNYHLGGAGKTPTTLAVARILCDAGETPFVVSRGYGGELPGPVRVESGHRASEVGDEPLMMSAHVPVVVARDRVAGARLAKGEGASVVLLDDGFQNSSLIKDASLIVIDGTRALGNAKVFPSGPLRAPLAPQIAKTEAIIVIGHGSAADDVVNAVISRGGLGLRASFQPAAQSLAGLKGKPLLAFAGIGDPERFFATLRGQGLNVVKVKSFADHHRFTPADLALLTADAAQDGLSLVTTEKDMVRISSDPALANKAKDVTSFAVGLRIAEDDALRAFLHSSLAKARSSF
ncbi:MAG: tetraacyldisaccharide 4'-kinase [Xanthobacteraceae bacterium]|nr:tetraacyldisaccharide 4'-kinase [Xanthobacteraceae bacterium]